MDTKQLIALIKPGLLGLKLFVLAGILGVVLFFSFSMITPHLTSLLWACVLSVPLHSLKSSIIALKTPQTTVTVEAKRLSNLDCVYLLNFTFLSFNAS